MRMVFRTLAVALALALLALIAQHAIFGACTGGVVKAEAASVKARVDARADEIVAKLESLERGMNDRFESERRRLESIDAKLDRILDLAAPPLPDGMKEAK